MWGVNMIEQNPSYNPLRGDVQISLNGTDIVLRPTFVAILRLEERYDRSIFDIARDYAAGKLSKASDLAVLIKAGIEGAGGHVPDDFEGMLLRHGLARLLAPVGKFLVRACGLEDAET